jgi:trk system potassium uptake protein TrkA
MGIDTVIFPEVEVAEAIYRRLEIPGAFDAIPLVGNLVTLIGVRCTPNCPVINTPLRHLTTLFPDLHVTVIGITRGDTHIVPDASEVILADDQVYFIAETTHLKRALAAFGHEEQAARRLVIVGGGHIGTYLAAKIGHSSPDAEVKIIEIDRTQAEHAAQQLPRFAVIRGDALKEDILAEANVAGAETIVAVSNNDEVNILASLLAKKAGCQRSITLVNSASYAPLVGGLGIDAVVSPRATTVSMVLQHIRRGKIHSVHSLGDDFGEVMEMEALETSRLTGVPLRDMDLPDGVIIGAIVRAQAVIMPQGDTVIEPHDQVVLFARSDMVRRVQKIFAVRLEFF